MMQKIDFRICNASSDDAFAVSLIEQECFSCPWSENQIKEEINRQNAIFLVALLNSDLCGYISGQLILDEFYINNVAVTEKYRNNGIASALIEELTERLKLTECSFATLEVRESNYNARRVYEKHGFKLLGQRKSFYSHPTENACIYTLYFNESECKN